MQMAEYIEKPDMQYILHIKCDKNVEKRLIDFCLESVVDVFEDTGLTADVQPVKYGRWIGIYEWAKMHDSRPSGMCTYFWCSECQTAQEKKSNFCPNCGAKMDESEDDKHE